MSNRKKAVLEAKEALEVEMNSLCEVYSSVSNSVQDDLNEQQYKEEQLEYLSEKIEHYDLAIDHINKALNVKHKH